MRFRAEVCYFWEVVAIKSIDTLTDYYKTRNEGDRLLSKSGAVEFIVTTAYINKYLKRGDHILEVGCGTGQYTLFYARKGYTVDAVEWVESNLNSVQRLHYIGTDMFTQYFPEQIESMDDSVLVKQNCNTSVQNFSEKLRIYSTVSLTMSL